MLLGDYKHFLEGEGYSVGKNKYLKRNNRNHARINFESPVKRYYLCRGIERRPSLYQLYILRYMYNLELYPVEKIWRD
ncbi:hypothetical protein IMSAGC022_01058 [Alistipes sp.]|nr:hypothetical protein IMSAGC022_01058 [Alistipes sp.]